MIQCASGHFFDEKRHTSCPYCLQPFPATAKTVALQPTPPAAAPPPPFPATMPLNAAAMPLNAAPGAHPATVRLVREASGIDPVVGWLVCIEGPDRGRDFRLRAEKNFLGRDAAMQVALAADDAVSRQKHATIVFEPSKREFWLLPGDGAGLVYRNGEAVYAPVQLQDRDQVGLGRTKLLLVTFLNDAFSW
jgi:hypothetical protein